MAIVKIKFDGGDVPVVTGAPPALPTTPIQNPVDVHANSNHFFFAAAGLHTYGLRTDIAHTPLWLTVDAVDGDPQTVTFTSV